MAQSKETSLFLAILALDAYNRNYNPGYTAVQDNTSTVAVKGSAIGDAYVIAKYGYEIRGQCIID
jgi:hypothetical protein